MGSPENGPWERLHCEMDAQFTPDSVTIISPPDKGMMRVVWLVFIGGLCLYIAGAWIPAAGVLLGISARHPYPSLQRIASLSGDEWFHLAAAVTILGMYTWSLAKGVLGESDTLHATRDSLQLTLMRWGKVRPTVSLPRAAVELIRFGSVKLSKYGNGNGLIFKAKGKTYKCLAGLESPEVHRILASLKDLGYVVEEDPGMAMMVEMALERRSKKKS